MTDTQSTLIAITLAVCMLGAVVAAPVTAGTAGHPEPSAANSTDISMDGEQSPSNTTSNNTSDATSTTNTTQQSPSENESTSNTNNTDSSPESETESQSDSTENSDTNATDTNQSDTTASNETNAQDEEPTSTNNSEQDSEFTSQSAIENSTNKSVNTTDEPSSQPESEETDTSSVGSIESHTPSTAPVSLQDSLYLKHAVETETTTQLHQQSTPDTIRVAIEPSDSPQDTADDARLYANEVTVQGPIVYATVPVTNLKTLAAAPSVEYVREPVRVTQVGDGSTSTSGSSLIGADQTRAAGLTGSDTTVAIIDLGFSRPHEPVSDAVIEYNTEFDYDSRETRTEHGDSVSEIVHDVAPDADLVQYQVDGTLGAVTSAADQIANRDDIDVVVVALGISPGSGSVEYDGTDAISQEISQQNDQVWTVAAGNSADSFDYYFTEYSPTEFDDHNFGSTGTTPANLTAIDTPNDRFAAALTWNQQETNKNFRVEILTNSSGNYSVIEKNGEPLVFENRPGRSTLVFDADLPEGTSDAAIRIVDTDGTVEAGTTNLGFTLGIGTLADKDTSNRASLNVPATSPDVVTVGAVDAFSETPLGDPIAYRDTSGPVETYSSRGPVVDGRQGLDLVGPTYVFDSGGGAFAGTSAATPYVGGTAALVHSQNPSAQPTDIETQLEQRSFSVTGKPIAVGAGHIDAAEATAVEATNAAPSASDIDVSTSEDSPVSETFSASDPDGDSLSYAIESPPSDGTVSVSGDSFTYTPESISSGTDSFVYRVNDGNGGADTATVTIDLSTSGEQNQPPEVDLDVNPASAEVDQSVTFDGTGASDPDGRITEYRWDFDGDGTIDRTTSTETVTYAYAEAGSYTPELTAVDDDGATGTDTTTVSVGSENAAPIANDIDISTSEDSPASETFAASDPDGDSLSYTIESPPSDGTVSVSGDSFTYTPESISSGTDSFVYRVNDGNGGTDTATVSVTVTEPNTNDGYEPNDAFDTAASITDGSYTDLQIVDGESDYFAVTLEESASIDASIGFDHNTGDLDMTLYGPDREELADSTSTSDGESVSATEVSEGGTYYVEVRGYSGASTPYDMSVDVASPQPTGVITGNVVDTEANPIPGAQVRITNASGSVIAETTTDSSGIYTIEVPSGEYTVIAESNGSTTEQTVFVEPGATINADIVIQTTGSESAVPAVSVSNAPDRVGPNETFTIEYEIENTGTVTGPFILDIPAPTPRVTVQNIDGDIQGSDTSAEPTSAATNAVGPNETAAVGVTYDASDLSTEDLTVELTARQPLDSTSDSVSSTLAVAESTDPTERALQRFDDDGDDTIDRDEAVGAIVAYNIGSTIGGEEVTRTQVVRAIVAYNTGEPIES